MVKVNLVDTKSIFGSFLSRVAFSSFLHAFGFEEWEHCLHSKHVLVFGGY
jgi:hypothetical protein